jgi:hypothetical protein
MLKIILISWTGEISPPGAMARPMPDKRMRSMHNISARNNQGRVIYGEGPYRRDTAKPLKTYMKKRAKPESLTRPFQLASLTT